MIEWPELFDDMPGIAYQLPTNVEYKLETKCHSFPSLIPVLRVQVCVQDLRRLHVLQQTACLVVNPITVGNFAFLLNCTPVGQTSDSMMVQT